MLGLDIDEVSGDINFDNYTNPDAMELSLNGPDATTKNNKNATRVRFYMRQVQTKLDNITVFFGTTSHPMDLLRDDWLLIILRPYRGVMYIIRSNIARTNSLGLPPTTAPISFLMLSDSIRDHLLARLCNKMEEYDYGFNSSDDDDGEKNDNEGHDKSPR